MDVRITRVFSILQFSDDLIILDHDDHDTMYSLPVVCFHLFFIFLSNDRESLKIEKKLQNITKRKSV